MRYFPSKEKALKAFEEMTRPTTAQKRAKTAPADSKTSTPPTEEKRGRPRKPTPEQVEAERLTAYSMGELFELISYAGRGDNRVQMLADFMGGTVEDAKILLAEFDKKRR